MGTVHSFTELAAKMDQGASALDRAATAGVAKAGKIVGTALTAQGGTMRNLGKGGARLSASVKASGRQAVVSPRPGGAWTIREYGARPHVITPRGGYGGGKSLGSRKRRALAHASGQRVGGGDRRAVLNIPGIGYRKYAHHPGARPRPAWQRTVIATQPAAIEALHAEVVLGLARTFG